MGADLYRSGHDAIRGQCRPAFDAACRRRDTAVTEAEWAAVQADVEAAYAAMYPESHYFRDSYNSSSLFSRLGLDWWNDLMPYLGPDGTGPTTIVEDEDSYPEPVLHPAGARRLAADVARRVEQLEYAIRDDDPADQAYFRDKFDRFLAFLRAAAEAGDTIYCSV